MPSVFNRCSATLFLLLLVNISAASSGDRAPEFQKCLATCGADCKASPAPLPLALRVTRWTCLDDCKYTCMHAISAHAAARGDSVQQYYGKWPFWRFLGMQEPASVAFSLLNLWAHVRGTKLVRRTTPREHPMRRLYLMWAGVSINAWVWSAVFHTRDTPTTEKLDYFSAALAILFALYLTVVRLFHLYPVPARQRLTQSLADEHAQPRPSTTIARLWATLCLATYLLHISYLTLLPRFDYTYNIIFNLAVGLAHNALWLLYAAPASLALLTRFPGRQKTYRPAYAGNAALFVALTTAATALELFDFPPWAGAVDAHALWHLATAPIIPLWYAFLVQDALDEGWRVTKL